MIRPLTRDSIFETPSKCKWFRLQDIILAFSGFVYDLEIELNLKKSDRDLVKKLKQKWFSGLFSKTLQLEEVDEIGDEIRKNEDKIKQLRKRRRDIYQKHGFSIYGFHNLSITIDKFPELKEDIRKAKSFAEIARKYGVIPKTVRHWIDVLKLYDIFKENKYLCRKNPVFLDYVEHIEQFRKH